MMAKAGLLFLLRGFLVGCLAALAFVGPLAAAPGTIVPVPAITIYPGDKIRNSYLVDRNYPPDSQVLRAGVVTSRLALIGKLARRTLLPGLPIPANAVTDPDAVTNGEKVRVIFNQDGLVIETYAIALQAGSVGQVISVRNPDSGITISGIVQSDGSVRVGG